MVPVDMLRRVSHEDAVSQEIPLTGLMQNTSSILPAIYSQKSSNIADFCVFPALRYACALTNVNFFRSCIVSSIPAAPLSSKGPGSFVAHQVHFLMSSRKYFRYIINESMRLY